MRAPTDLSSRRAGSPSRRIWLIAAGLVLLTLVLSLKGIAGLYTDYLWFDEVSLTSVWSGILGTRLALGAVFTAAFFVLMWVNLTVADRISPTFRPMGPEEQFIERFHQVVGPRMNIVRVAVAGLFALLFGPGVSGQWHSWLLFRNQVSFGIEDAQFGRDIGYFVFKLPFLTYVVDWLFASVLMVLVMCAVAHYLNGGIRVQSPLERVTPNVKVHLSVLLAVLAALRAVSYFLQRYELVYSRRGVTQGAGYTDVNAQLPALKLLVLISVFSCILFLVNIARRGWVLPAVAVGVWALIWVVIGVAYPAAVQKFSVQPTESAKERPFIERNIAATRAAFNLGQTQVRNFEAEPNIDAGSLEANASTIRNVRLWDPEVVQSTYKALQEVRTFFQINDVDVDRYQIDGEETQVLLSVRELNSRGIPSPSWVNQHLVYTHGYGAVATAATGVARDGNPELLLKDLPPAGAPELTQPAIYFGQGVGSYALVNTKQTEIDYTDSAGVNVTSTYQGRGGVKMNSFLRRAALAARFGDLNPLISSFITPESRAIFVRNIDDRVRKAAPFLRYDADPYPVIHQGRIVWIYDAYTTTNRYPYAERANVNRVDPSSGLRSDFNYVRNSVKVVIDAYDGSMTFYVMDATDPLVRAYSKAFPKLFTDGSRMDPELREHLRYPEDLFRVQTNMYGLYHIEDPASFYNKTDAWDIAQDPGDVTGATTVNSVDAEGRVVQSQEERMDPYYLSMRLPGQTEDEFLLLQPFVPVSRDDSNKLLSAFMVAKSDPEDYGKLEVFVMPRDRQIDGPALVNAKINQQPDISREITQLGIAGAGSKVLLGNLLVIPIEKSLLYVRPLYVQAEATPLPQLKRVIVVQGDKVVMRESLREAMTAIFGSSPPTLELQGAGAPGEPATPGPSPTTPTTPTTPGEPTTPTTPTTPGVNATVTELINEANTRFDAAQAALVRGDLAGYQKETDAARELIRRAAEAAATPTTSTTAPATGVVSPAGAANRTAA